MDHLSLYRKITLKIKERFNVHFEEAMSLVKDGYVLTRACWENSYLTYNRENYRIIFNREEYICGQFMKTSYGYIPSHSDTVADDWKILE